MESRYDSGAMSAPCPTGVHSAELGVRDVAACARFYAEAWRLEPVAEHNGSVYLRGSGEHHHIVALHPRERAELLRLNLAAASRADVDALHQRVRRAGGEALEAPAEVEEPGGGYAFAFRDPEGRVVRVLAGERRHAAASASPERPIRITHVVLNTPRPERAAAFWIEALGFELSDRSLLTFIRCNADHHSIAFHPGESSTLHHIAFEMADIDAVMRGAGRLREHGHPIEWGVGRHGPGNNVFAYFVGPEDFVIEYTAEIAQVGPGHRVRSPEEWRYPPGRSDLWGVTPPPSERMRAAQAKIRFPA
jgi:catechol 2,3-dioxygenase-like lactoylglutathione lyase family enzyme